MNSKLMVVLALTLSACGGAPTGSIDYTPTLPVDPYAALIDGVHVLSLTCSNSKTVELSKTPSTRSLMGIVGSADFGNYADPYALTCQIKVVSIKNKAGRPYDVIITSGTPTSVTNGHPWPVASFPFCVGSTNLSSTSSCVSVGNPQTDSTGVATINFAIDGVRTWNGLINLRSSLKFNEDGNSYLGTNQKFAILSAYNETWVNNNGSTCSQSGRGSCSIGTYPGYVTVVAPADFNCQQISYGQDLRSVKSEPICQPL